VFLAIGFPPNNLNHGNINSAKELMYARNKFRRMRIVFENNRVSAVEN